MNTIIESPNQEMVKNTGILFKDFAFFKDLSAEGQDFLKNSGWYQEIKHICQPAPGFKEEGGRKRKFFLIWLRLFLKRSGLDLPRLWGVIAKTRLVSMGQLFHAEWKLKQGIRLYCIFPEQPASTRKEKRFISMMSRGRFLHKGSSQAQSFV